jgi:hypothetical protein
MGKKIFVILSCLFMLSACSVFNKKAPQDVSSVQTDSRAASRTAKTEKEANTVYYDFDDILVPKDMRLRPNDSLLFETPTVKAGVIMFEGRVEPVSLFNFFLNNMPKDNWELRSYFKYGRYIMVYEKPDRDCIISLRERSLSTQLQIWVTPRTETGFSNEGDMGPEATTLSE